MADDDDAHQGARASGRDRVELTGYLDVHGNFFLALGGLRAHHAHRSPALRRRSNASSDSRSMARPARSGILVAASSAMISSMVPAFDSTGKVMSASPSER